MLIHKVIMLTRHAMTIEEKMCDVFVHSISNSKITEKNEISDGLQLSLISIPTTIIIILHST